MSKRHGGMPASASGGAIPGRRAVFLDRDGTLNEDTGYVHEARAWRWLPGVRETLARLKAAGWLLVVVSNQSGIARGMFDEKALHALEHWVDAQLAPLAANMDAWYFCPHLPDRNGPCECRKPAPGLLLRAAAELDIDLAASWMVGDRLRDVRAGLAAGCRAVLLRNAGYREEALEAERLGVPVRDDLRQASECILKS